MFSHVKIRTWDLLCNIGFCTHYQQRNRASVVLSKKLPFKVDMSGNNKVLLGHINKILFLIIISLRFKSITLTLSELINYLNYVFQKLQSPNKSY